MENEHEILNEVKPTLEALLTPVPFINGFDLQIESKLTSGRYIDFIAELKIDNRNIKLIGEVKKVLQPRYALDAVRQVKEYCSYFIEDSAYPVVVSEYISPQSAEILTKENVSYFDLAGNCRLCFANVYIVKEGKKSKRSEKRGVKSLFGLKSSRMLRLMLSSPLKAWQVKELSDLAELSLGQVSNIRRALLDQHYAIAGEKRGIYINQPGALLDRWKRVYKKNIANHASTFYTLMPADERLSRARKAMAAAEEQMAGIMYSGLSSARWMAPFVKPTSDHFYADKLGIELLRKYLELEPVGIGPNVIIEQPKDPFIFKEVINCSQGLNCTSAVQTYLDLYVSGEREQEAAEYLEMNVLKEMWQR